MNLDGHRRFEEELGAYVLGQLDEDERTEFETHLNSCPVCRSELAQISPVATLLSKADPNRLEEPLASPPPLLAERIYERVGQERRREARRRPPGMGLAAAAAILAILFALTTLFVLEETGEQVNLQPVAVRTALPVAFQDLVATATLRADDYSTQVELEAEGLRPGQDYSVWIERFDGTRVPAGGFQAYDEGPVTVYLSAALPLDEAVGLVVGTPDGETAFRADLQGGNDADLIVPDLQGKTLEDAIETVGQDFEVEAGEDGEQSESTVQDQDPSPGDRARKGTEILVTLSDGRTSEDTSDSDSSEADDETEDPGPDDAAGATSDTALAAGSIQLVAANLGGLGQAAPGAGPFENAGEGSGMGPLDLQPPAFVPGIVASPAPAFPGVAPLLGGAPAPGVAPAAFEPAPGAAPAFEPAPEVTPVPDTVPGSEPAPENVTGPEQRSPDSNTTPTLNGAPQDNPGRRDAAEDNQGGDGNGGGNDGGGQGGNGGGQGGGGQGGGGNGNGNGNGNGRDNCQDDCPFPPNRNP